MSDEWTVGRLLQWTADYLKEHGSDSPRLDAEVLLAQARAASGSSSTRPSTSRPATTLRTAFRELVRRRAEGTPVAYLVGHREFYSLDFRVTPDVLIPRPETELLVVAAARSDQGARPAERPVDVADVGTGSGIIAITLARQAAAGRVTAIDISPAALAVARDNAERHGVAERIDSSRAICWRRCRPSGSSISSSAIRPTWRARSWPICRAT